MAETLSPITLLPIGSVSSPRRDLADDHWGQVVSEIHLDTTRFSGDALRGLDTFSHCDVLFWMHLVPDSEIVAGARHPRGRTDWPSVGIFAQRGKARPSRIGVTTCEVVEVAETILRVRGLDACDGTPVLDIRAYLSGFAPRSTVREPDWAIEIMRDYFL